MAKRTYKHIRVIFLGIIALALVGFALYSKYYATTLAPTKEPDTAFHPKATPAKTPAPSPVTPTPEPAIPPTTTPQTSESGQITVSQPTTGATVTDGTMIRGQARVFEGKINWFIKAKDGGQLGSGSAQVSGDAALLSNFEFPLSLTTGPAKAGDVATLEVYSISPKDGSAINAVDVSVYVQ